MADHVMYLIVAVDTHVFWACSLRFTEWRDLKVGVGLAAIPPIQLYQMVSHSTIVYYTSVRGVNSPQTLPYQQTSQW